MDLFGISKNTKRKYLICHVELGMGSSLTAGLNVS